MRKILGYIILLLVIILSFYFVAKKYSTPKIEVLSPKVGDAITEGQSVKIEWKTKNIPDTYKISVAIRRIPPPPLQEEGQEFDPLVFTNLPNTGSSDWLVSDMYPEGNYVITLTAYESLPVTNPISAESGEFSIKKDTVIGGTRDVHGCLTPAGYGWSEDVGACIRAFDMTPDIMKAAKKAVDYVGREYALTVVSFNSYEEPGEYDIFFERGTERIKQIVYFRNHSAQKIFSDTVCHDSPKYFVVEQSIHNDIGSNILIKYKTSPTQKLQCLYRVSNGDFELKNVDAEYFQELTENFLVLDRGTGPSLRWLIAYDLNKRTKIFETSYFFKFDDEVDVNGASITYWEGTNQKATLQNCPKMNEYISGGLGAEIVSKTKVNLQTLAKTSLGEFECIATQ